MTPDSETLPFMAETPYCDFSHCAVTRQARRLRSASGDKRDYAIKAFYFVRDSIIWELGNWNKKASDTLITGIGSCSNKANLLVALLRAEKIPSGFVVMTVSMDYFGSIIPSEFALARQKPGASTKHFLAAVHLGGEWLQVDATDDIGVSRCAPYVKEADVVEFDGRADARLNIDSESIHRINGPLASIDSYLGRPPVNALGLRLMFAKKCQEFVRTHGAAFESACEMHAALDKWLWRHHPMTYFLFKAVLWSRRLGDS